jgi:hypothetical protein
VRALLLSSAGLAFAGIPGAMLGLITHGLLVVRARARLRPDLSLRPILLLLLVELRTGSSILGAVQAAARAFPDRLDLVRASRLATVSGLNEAVAATRGGLRSVLSQLARAQRSGASLADTVRGMIEADIAAEKTRRVARARTLPVRLMIPISLLVLPGLVLLFYAPSLLLLFEQLSEPLS